MLAISICNKPEAGMKRIGRIMFCLCFGISTCLLTPALVQAKETAGNVLRVTGRATLTSPDGDIRKVEKGSRIISTDIISTSARSYVRMKMEDESYIMLRPDSRLVIDDFSFNKKNRTGSSLFSLLKGGFRAISGLIKNKKKYKYRTAIATIGIRGTEFSVRVCNADCYEIDPVPENGLFLEVHDQEIIITTGAGDFSFTKGQYAYVASSDSPAVLIDDIPDVFDQSPIPPADPADCEQ